MNNEFKPTNELEQLLISVQYNQIDFTKFIKFFLQSELVMPSAIEDQKDGSIVPLFFKKEEQDMLSVFTSLSLLKIYDKNIKRHLILSGESILIRMPPGIGLVINPGYSAGFDISADGIRNIINDFIAINKK